jgi:hypothetical protein
MSDDIQYSGRGHRLNHLEDLRMDQLRKKNELLSHQLKQQVERKSQFDDIARNLKQLLEDHESGKITPSSTTATQ